MNLEKLYQEMGGDMADAVRRLGSIAAVERFLRMFAGDDTFAMLEAAMSAGDVQRAFRAAHTLKGLAANLGLVQLGQAASALTEALRGSDMQRASALYPETAAAYRAGVRGDRRFRDGRVENTDFGRCQEENGQMTKNINLEM